MGCSRSGGVEHALELDGEPTGVLTGHAYGITKIFELKDDKMVNPRKTHRLILVRNPWGNTEWSLDWSTNSEKLSNHRKELEEWIAELESDEQFILDADDGLFLMNYKSFRQVFNKIFIA